MLDVETTVNYFEPLPDTESLRTRLETLLASTWSDTWLKSPKPAKPRSQRETNKKRTHESVYRILEKFRRRKPKPKAVNSS